MDRLHRVQHHLPKDGLGRGEGVVLALPCPSLAGATKTSVLFMGLFVEVVNILIYLS
jgi:hypothetical protein